MNKKRIILVGIYLASLANAIVFTVIIPFASKMVISFGMTNSRSTTGTWVGIITFSLMIGRTITSPFWGWICDKWGRRPVILIGIASITVFSLLFGFSRNIYWAMMCRFLLGVFTPLAIVIKTLLSEICPGDEQPNAMAWQTLLWQIGMVSGNVIGGLLEDPKSSGLIDSGIFVDYPFLLPNFVAALMGLCAFLMVYPFLEETLDKSDMKDSLIGQEGRSFMQIAADPLVSKVLGVYTILSNNSTAMHELVSLYLYADIVNGGFSMDPDEIGLLLAASAISLVFFQKLIFSSFISRYGLVKTSNMTTFLAVPILLIIPISSWFRNTTLLKWFILALFNIIWITVNFISFTSVSCMSNNSVVNKERGRMNGLFMTVGSLARSIAPLLFGWTFATTVESGWIFPFNYAFSFYLLAAGSVAMWIICKMIPESLNGPKVEESIAHYTQMSIINKA
ncbi:unnamed protein product [Blepharisma stoltei]|uniref:Major facilitator superfamily (MFS) profile domain-containing protein n=1 Tax=Blepharisma stoltei TaxID=1481888 RepID=A0AAU9K8Z4_9CILI|nr:unnamed protein product [Blepharisma stoltei]